MGKTFEEIQRENEEWARQHPEASENKPRASSGAPYGLINHLRDITGSTASATRPLWRIGGAMVRPARGLYRMTMTRRGTDGKRHFSPKRAACTVIIGACLVAASPFLAMGAYYYGTLRDIDNVYIPDAAVFVNQQFETANLPGRHVTSRDEIYTVMGRWRQPDGVVEPVRFDIDTNAYFPQYGATMRPDLAAAKLNSQSPFGVKAKLKVTGFYAMLPRFIRFKVVKWFNLRSEIVEVLDVKELTSLPSFAKTVDESGMNINGLHDAAGKPQPLVLPQNQQAVLPSATPKL